MQQPPPLIIPVPWPIIPDDMSTFMPSMDPMELPFIVIIDMSDMSFCLIICFFISIMLFI